MRRGKERWTHADDRRLGRALLAVFASQGDVVVLSDNCALWKLVQQRYQGLVAAEQAVVPDVTAAPRSARSLHTRWSRGIRPDMALFVSLVDKLQKAGKTPAKAIKQAAKLFREERSETNATAVRQYVQERQTPSGDSETDSGRPKLKFESFHFRHCYDILSSNAKFVHALLGQDKGKDRDSSEHGPRKRRRTSGADEYSSSTSSDGSDTEELMLHDAPAGRIQLAKVGAISSRQVPAQSSSWPHARANGVPVHPSASDSVVITFDDTLQEDRRLKLLAELRGVVTTISQLAQQLAWNGVASAALAARTGGVCPALDEDVLRDIAFFRHEKQRLKQQIDAIDGNASSN